MKNKKRFRINKGLITQKIGKKLTIFDGNESALYSFNESGSYIFNKIKQGWQKEKIIAEVSKKYDINEQLVRKDVEMFIHQLKRKHIILE